MTNALIEKNVSLTVHILPVKYPALFLFLDEKEKPPPGLTR
jgi:hypothetical protein